jgi:phosphatidate phosphatase APP1
MGGAKDNGFGVVVLYKGAAAGCKEREGSKENSRPVTLVNASMSIKNTLSSLGAIVHREWDDVVDRLGWGNDKPVCVANYIGFGREDYLYLTGRVLRDRGVRRNERDKLLDNVVNNFKRFNSREIRGASVKISWGEHTFERTTDSEGYFYVEHTCPPDRHVISHHQLWQEAEITVTAIPGEDIAAVVAHSAVVVPMAAEFGVISDIDDTILQTDVTSWLKLKMMLHTLLKNAGKRHAFDGVSDFYQALSLGQDGAGYNPFFYVSNSPWNLYDLLLNFLDLNHFPRGPVLLRDFGLPAEDTITNYKTHKADMVKRVLTTYPALNFILIGDSGEHDTDIYLEAARNHPGRILAIYIRDVQHERRARRIQALIETVADIDVFLVSSYEEAATHARNKGWICVP